MTNAELKIIMKLKDEATKKITKFQGRMLHAANTIKKNWIPITAGIIATTFALKKLAEVSIGVGKELIATSSKVEQLQVRLKVLLGSAEKGNQVFEDMADLASRVPKTYDEIMESATDLSAVVKDGTKEVKQLMPIIVDLSAATGMSVREVTGQMIRMYSAGAAAADMFRERGVSAALGFKAGVSTTAEETMKIIIKQWEDGTGKFVGASKELATSFAGMTSMMQDAWFQFKIDIGKEIFESVKDDLSAVLEIIKESKEEGGKYGKVVEDLAGFFDDAYNSAKDFFVDIVTGSAQAIDFINELSSAIANIQMSIAGLTKWQAENREKSREFWDFLPWVSDEPEEKLNEIREFYEAAKEIAFNAREEADKDYSTMAKNIITNIRTAVEQKKEEILANQDEIDEELKTKSDEVQEEITNNIIKKQQNVIDGLRGVWQAWNDEKLSMEMARIQSEAEFYNLAIDARRKAHESMWVSVGKMRDVFSKDMSKLFVDMIKGTADVKKTFEDLGWKMVQTLMDYGAQMVVNSVLSKALMAVQVATSSAAAATIASAWAPAAALVSLATMGGNAGPAAGALAGIAALAQALAIPKLEKGGDITGSGLTLVGERGPELLNLPRGAQVRPIGNTTIGETHILIQISLDGAYIGAHDIADQIAPAIKERLDDLEWAERRRA